MNDVYHLLMQEKLYIYTEDFFLLPRLKNVVKRFLGKARGPEAVFQSLVKGLVELGIGCQINRQNPPKDAELCVINGVKTLEWAIEQKKEGWIGKIIAGPNIIIEPSEAGGILKSSEIDKILVPSQWVKDFYISLAPELSLKIYIWAAGVDIPEESGSAKEFDFLIFNKLDDAPLAREIKVYLNKEHKRYCEVIYGKFTHEEYFKLIEKSKAVIYLSESESQGLAMFEAWARNAPTLVWERGFLEYGKHRWEGNTATPYLSEQTGMKFRGMEDFKKILPGFTAGKFSPREWVKHNGANKIAAQKYLENIRV